VCADVGFVLRLDEAKAEARGGTAAKDDQEASLVEGRELMYRCGKSALRFEDFQEVCPRHTRFYGFHAPDGRFHPNDVGLPGCPLTRLPGRQNRTGRAEHDACDERESNKASTHSALRGFGATGEFVTTESHRPRAVGEEREAQGILKGAFPRGKRDGQFGTSVTCCLLAHGTGTATTKIRGRSRARRHARRLRWPAKNFE
jgi:hypothetical protein